MAQSDARFDYVSHLGKDDHDLSAPLGMTCTSGMLLPVFCDFATPGDTYYIQHDLDFMRTIPMLKPAMVDVKVHFESFFVPIEMIYQPAENTLFSINEMQSSLFDYTKLMNANFPLFDYQFFISDIIANNMNTPLHADAFRLADLFELYARHLTNDAAQDAVQLNKKNFFPYQILAYHCIYEYFYRLDDKSQFSNARFNVDKYYDSTLPFTMGNNFMEIHQRAWDFDYFTSAYRSPIVSTQNMQDILPNGVYNDLFNGASSTSVQTLGITKAGIGSSGSNSYIAGFTSTIPNSPSNTDIRLGINTAQIRQMFANEKLAMITGRARKTYDSQVMAHYGVHVPHDPKHDITFIGGDTYDLHVGEVTSLASTTGTPLGDLAGKGWASSYVNGKSIAKNHKFTVPHCHGVIMTIFSVEPKRRYLTIDTFNKRNAIADAFDFPTPAFDRLGNQPMFGYECNYTNPGTGLDNDIVNWKERYYPFKRRFPRVTASMMNYSGSAGYNSYRSFMINTQPYANASIGFGAGSSRPGIESRYYIGRNVLDALFTLPFVDDWYDGSVGHGDGEDWNTSPWLAYQRDPFICDLNVKVKKVSWMSKDGEPIYPY